MIEALESRRLLAGNVVLQGTELRCDGRTLTNDDFILTIVGNGTQLRVQHKKRFDTKTFEDLTFSLASVKSIVFTLGVGDDRIATTSGSIINIPFTVNAGSGDDLIGGSNVRDHLFGEGGNDTIFAGAGDDQIVGQDGDDHLFGDAGADGMEGGNGNDELRGGAGDDFFMVGNAGNDQIFGDDGNDLIVGAEGNDLLDGGAGIDDMQGNDGADVMRGGPDRDRMRGGAGNDDIRGDDGDDVIDGDSGNDLLRGDAGPDNIHGGDGDDQILGGAGGDVLFGEAGNDVVHGGDDNDILNGGTGIDKIFGERGDDTATDDGGAGSIIDLGVGEDGLIFTGTLGDDAIQVGRRVTKAGPVCDFILNGVKTSVVYANGETITVNGLSGNDYIAMDASAGLKWKARFFGQAGNDLLIGAQQDDLLDGGTGVNILIGNGGVDDFRRGIVAG